MATIFLIMMPVGAFLIFWAAFLRRAYADVPLKKSSLYPGHVPAKPLVTVAFIFVILFIIVRWWHPTQNSLVGGAAAGGKSGAQKTQPGHQQYEPHFQWFPVFIIGSLVVGIGGALAFLALRRRHEELERAPVREALAEVLSETLDDLRREPDPRKAVIGAYAKMERTLAARGFPRRESEAPLEYLGRILGIVEGSGHSARRLTRLFERARFSPHEIDQKMKDDAIDSLVGLRAQLEAEARPSPLRPRQRGDQHAAGGDVITAALRWVGLAVLAVIALVAARMISPGRRDLELDVFILVLGGIGLLVLAAELRRLAPTAERSLVEEALDPEPAEKRPIADLLRLERALSMASARQFDLHYRLRPILRDVAAARLEQRGLDLDSGRPVVQELLGDELFELTAPDREPPANRLAPGPGVEGLDRTIGRLERL